MTGGGVAALDAMFTRTRAEHRAALMGYLPVGYPDLPCSVTLFDALIEGGCDAIEVGMPFSDPVIDGPVVATAQRAALAAGFRTRDLFGVVERIASRGVVPVVMGYFNPVLAYGVDAFARDLAGAGGAGMITPDLIVDEADAWRAAAAQHDLAPIFLVAPSSPAERIALTTAACRGLVYAASVMGTTGVRDAVSVDAPDLVARCREHTALPIGVGLGVRTGEQAAQIASFADAVIVGSALVAAAGRGPAADAAAVRDLAIELAAGVRHPRGTDVTDSRHRAGHTTGPDAAGTTDADPADAPGTAHPAGTDPTHQVDTATSDAVTAVPDAADTSHSTGRRA